MKKSKSVEAQLSLLLKSKSEGGDGSINSLVAPKPRKGATAKHEADSQSTSSKIRKSSRYASMSPPPLSPSTSPPLPASSPPPGLFVPSFSLSSFGSSSSATSSSNLLSSTTAPSSSSSSSATTSLVASENSNNNSNNAKEGKEGKELKDGETGVKIRKRDKLFRKTIYLGQKAMPQEDSFEQKRAALIKKFEKDMAEIDAAEAFKSDIPPTEKYKLINTSKVTQLCEISVDPPLF